MKRELLIVEIKTRQVVERIEVTGKSENVLDPLDRGMLINMDRERFYVDDKVTP